MGCKMQHRRGAYGRASASASKANAYVSEETVINGARHRLFTRASCSGQLRELSAQFCATYKQLLNVLLRSACAASILLELLLGVAHQLYFCWHVTCCARSAPSHKTINIVVTCFHINSLGQRQPSRIILFRMMSRRIVIDGADDDCMVCHSQARRKMCTS